MKKEELFQAMNEIDDDLLLESEIYKRPNEIRKIVSITSIGCCLIMFGLMIFDTSRYNYPEYINPFVEPYVPLSDEPSSAYNPSLAMLNLTFKDNIYGAESYWVKDITDLLSENTWNESVVYKELPVYQNHLEFDAESLKEQLKKTAKQLGMNVTDNNIKVTDDFYFEKAHIIFLEVEDDQYLLKMEGNDKADINTSIYFKQPLQLPKGLYNGYDATLEEKNNLGHYYKDIISSTFDLKNPQIRMSGGGYNIDQTQNYDLFYIEGDSKIYDAMSQKIYVYGNEESNCIDFIRIVYEKNYQAIGNYPVISVGKAKTKLLKGEYFTSCQEPFINKDILKVEMVYQSSLTSDIVIPYYRFYMGIDNDAQNQMKHLGVYYIPAIEEQYFENHIYWQGEFNR